MTLPWRRGAEELTLVSLMVAMPVESASARHVNRLEQRAIDMMTVIRSNFYLRFRQSRTEDL